MEIVRDSFRREIKLLKKHRKKFVKIYFGKPYKIPNDFLSKFQHIKSIKNVFNKLK